VTELRLVWLNHSSLSDGEVSRVAASIALQVVDDFAPIWGTLIRAFAFDDVPAAGDWVVEVLDDSDVKGALGYHDLSSGVPWMKVFQKTCAQYDVTWSSCASHEVLEGLADPYVDRTIQVGPQRFFALEVCDPVEVIGYDKNGVEVSDFVTPQWFDGHAFDKLNWLDTVLKPRQLLKGGYIGVWTPTRGWGTKNAEGAVVREHRRRREVYEVDER
jgi:hypothetical protein